MMDSQTSLEILQRLVISTTLVVYYLMSIRGSSPTQHRSSNSQSPLKWPSLSIPEECTTESTPSVISVVSLSFWYSCVESYCSHGPNTPSTSTLSPRFSSNRRNQQIQPTRFTLMEQVAQHLRRAHLTQMLVVKPTPKNLEIANNPSILTSVASTALVFLWITS